MGRVFEIIDSEADYMDMPCICPACGDWVELNDMKRARRRGRLLCPDCVAACDDSEPDHD